ncbi:TonB-dependent receptor [Sphingomonas sp. CL5.1]|uniref:TonB-dependent receptor domain-containing protein n=1 Tax=Sphingomonas sp. CL5.1 TaxID=2653203 RepID=UPI001581CB6E|nr:TonB-dependent receptor [Sphingomonas sp. CL5.1]QKR98832.1 TonB-dependent receptor [Sphingomonas sp. CL5.1]
MRVRAIAALMATSALTFAVPAVAETAPAPAAAQGQAAQDQSAPAQTTPDVVVTGTRIVRDGYTAPTPVTVATTDDLLKSTPSGVPDALNKLPQFANSLSPSKAASNFSNLPIHGNILNLRGLGTTGANPKGPLRTLILFDGLRVSPTEYVGTIDTNVLPELLMQRVDVVTGGASAAWGSDAVAGVVNFVLDKNFNGLSGVAQAGVAQRGYAASQRIGIAGGTGFAGGRGHIEFSAEYNNNDGMKRADRDFSNKGYNYVGSVVGGGTPGTATNPYTIGTDVRISALTSNARITSASSLTNPLIGQVVNPDGTTRPFNTGTAVGTTGFQSGGDGYGITQQNAAIIPGKTYNTFGRLSYDVSDGINAYVQGLFSRSDYVYPTQTNALVPPSEAVNLYSGNPYLSPAMQATLAGPNDYLTVGSYDAGQPQPLARERTDYWMATAGLDGHFGDFKWSLNYTHGQSVHHMATSGLYDNKKLFAATDVVMANGVPTCRVLTDPTVAAQYAGCQPLNLLAGNPAAATPAGYAYATGTSRYDATIKQDSVTASISGSLFNLPAGPVDLAAGVEWRNQSLDLTSNADPADLDTAAKRSAYFAGLRGVPAGALFYWLTNVGQGHGSYNVKEGFAELAVPILKDAPLFQELSLNGAVRVTDYSTSGTVTTWKAGGTWKLVQDFLLRATYSRDIRAPNLFELYSGAQSAIGIINDKQNAAGTIGSGINQNVSSVTSGNLGLKPEKAKTLTIGAVLTPRFLPGFSMSVDYYSIKVDSLIDQLSAQQIVDNCTNSGGTGPECALITRSSPTAFPTLIRIAPANIAFLKTAGIDFDATYRTSLGNGGLALRLYANYLDKFDTQQYAGAPTLHYAGVNVVGSNPAGYPRWRGSLTADYSTDRFGLTISEQMVGSMRLDIPGALPNGARVSFVDDHVGAVFYTDLTLRAKVDIGEGKHFEPFLTINNLFDKDPPLIPGTVPGVNLPTNIAVYDFVGRAFTAGVRFKF